jgi:Uma2 family endonuclease
MATVATAPTITLPGEAATAAPFFPAYGDHRTVFPGVSWEVYESLSRAQCEGNHVHLAYDGKDLEIMMTGYLHEILKELAGHIIKAVISWRGIAHLGSGEATLNAANANRGLQADLSYCFEADKLQMASEAVARGSMELSDYPRPDLAVEIDILPSQVDRPSIYAALDVSEVWRIKRDRTVIIEHLQADGSYVQVETSRFLDISAEEIHGWLTADDVGQQDVWYRRLNRWAMGLGPVA